VNKSQLVAALALRARMSKAVASRAVHALFAPGGVIASELKKGNKVQVTGFGNFEIRRREARKGRDPRTGKEISIASRMVAVFRAGRGLSEAIGKRK
jgi:DNA-binding protein HU-beta